MITITTTPAITPDVSAAITYMQAVEIATLEKIVRDTLESGTAVWAGHWDVRGAKAVEALVGRGLVRFSHRDGYRAGTLVVTDLGYRAAAWYSPVYAVPYTVELRVGGEQIMYEDNVTLGRAHELVHEADGAGGSIVYRVAAAYAAAHDAREFENV